MAQDETTISVVVCTYNRVGLLRNALDSLLIQLPSIRPGSIEVIVVDNNSTDGTESVVREYMLSCPWLRYCRETVQGLSHARNRGYRVANGAYVGYLDDDCKVPPGWIDKVTGIARLARADVFGGPFYPYYISKKPKWYKDEYGTFSYAGEGARELRREYVFGGNMFIRKGILEALGGFNTALGMNGGELGYAEEVELQDRIRREVGGATICYDPDIFLYHLVRPEKMTFGWRFREVAARVRAARVRYPHSGDGRAVTKIRLAAVVLNKTARLLWGLIVGLVYRDREAYPQVQNYIYERVFRDYGRLLAVWSRLVTPRVTREL